MKEISEKVGERILFFIASLVYSVWRRKGISQLQLLLKQRTDSCYTWTLAIALGTAISSQGPSSQVVEMPKLCSRAE